MKYTIFIFLSFFLIINHAIPGQSQPRGHSTGAYAFVGEVRHNSAIFQIVPCSLPFRADSWILNVWSEEGREEIETGGLELEFSSSAYLPVQHQVELSPGLVYHYQFTYSLNDSIFSAVPGKFRMPGTDGRQTVSFAMVTGMNRERFCLGRNFDGKGAATANEQVMGFPGLLAIEEKAPDFFIGNGDNVYYDQPKDEAAQNRQAMAMKWHWLWRQPRFVSMSRDIATYWLKDDHDYRYNDADTLSRNTSPSHQLGIDMFRQMAPVAYPREQSTYRTIRYGDDLQIWFVENRDCRSPNDQPDGPGKSIWGKEQREWLQQSLMRSGASFKLLVSPTPMIGPDDAYKRDNHANTEGFRRERNEFFKFILDNKLDESFLILCGDRHWQYHSVHPTGIEEFSCGALVQQNARAGRLSGQESSTDPSGRLRQPYVQDSPQAGFIYVALDYDEKGGAFLEIVFYDLKGNELYRYKKTN